MSLPHLAGGRDGGVVPPIPGGLGGTGGQYAASARAASIRSGAGSARSAASAISMHVNSYSYLSSRVYDFLQARSSWLRRTEKNELEGGGDEGGDALKVRRDGPPTDSGVELALAVFFSEYLYCCCGLLSLHDHVNRVYSLAIRDWKCCTSK